MHPYFTEYLNNNIINDMELKTKIFAKIDNTVTKYGKMKLKQQLTMISSENIPFLINLNYEIYNNHEFKYIVKDSLLKINELIPEIDIWYDYKKDKKFYFKTSWLNFSHLLNISNKLKFSNAFITIFIYLIVYFYFIYIKIPISITGYFKNIYNSYLFVSRMIISFFTKNKKIITFTSLLLCYSYISYQIYNSYIFISRSLDHYNNCAEFSKKYKKIILFIKSVKKLGIYDKYICTPIINTICEKLLKDFQNNKNIGYHLSMKLYCNDYKNDFTILCNYIGKLDARLSICELLDNHWL